MLTLNRKVVIVIVLTILIIGGGIYWWRKSMRDVKNESLRTQQVLQEQINKLEMQRTEEKTTIHFFKVYGEDRGVMHEEINFYVAIPENLTLLEKLRLLADRLSRFKFRYLPINVLRIENRRGKKIAIVELNEINPSYHVSWRSHYFQGSAGGYFTTITLTKSFLQEDYKGEWIDGVEFYYEGKPISDDWDHISLSGTIYRKSNREK